MSRDDAPPVAERHPTTRRHHGHAVVDDFAWMRDISDPRMIDHIAAESAWTERSTSHLNALMRRLVEEFEQRTVSFDLTVPVRRGSYWYYSRSESSTSYRTHLRVPVNELDEGKPLLLAQAQGRHGQVVLDEDAEARGLSYFALGTVDVSDDESLLLWSADEVGQETYVIRVRPIDSDDATPVDTISSASRAAFFASHGKGLFYVAIDGALRSGIARYHPIGSAGLEDCRLYEETDHRFSVAIRRSRSGRYLFIESQSHTSSETRFVDLLGDPFDVRVVWCRRPGVHYFVEHAIISGEHRLVILHNYETENYEVVDVAVDDPGGTRRQVIAHSPSAFIDRIEVFATHLVAFLRQDAGTRLAILSWKEFSERKMRSEGALERDGLKEIGFGEGLYTISPLINPEWTQAAFTFAYSSFVTAPSVYAYDFARMQLTMLKTSPMPGHHARNYRQERSWARSPDGTAIPISLVWKEKALKDLKPAPLILYVYGAYGHSIEPSFSPERLSLLDRGVAFAVAHVRGGGEGGVRWHEAGKGFKKSQGVEDLLAVARHLIDSGWTTSRHLVSMGESAGGLLVAAAANREPGLFAGVVATSPFVDPLNAMLDTSIPLTVAEQDEWGEPIGDPSAYENLRSLSPYENVREEVEYPPVLAIAGYHDRRVSVAEPAKWVARLRQVGAYALLRTEWNAGHAGPSGRQNRWREQAFASAWILQQAKALTRSDRAQPPTGSFETK